MEKYTHHAVIGKTRHSYGTTFLRYGGQARKTPKRVFTRDGGRWERRYDPSYDEVWLFDTEDDARDFISKANAQTDRSVYDKHLTRYENTSERCREFLKTFVEANPPLGDNTRRR